MIMNAGDELRLRFPEQPAARGGWRRDFVLIGDGWEKDGDYNTGFSQTVLPLPSHDSPAYGAGPQRRRRSRTTRSTSVTGRTGSDFHTRYVTPTGFLRGLRPD